MTKKLICLLACAVAANAAEVSVVPTRIQLGQSSVSIQADQSIRMETASGSPIEAFGAQAGFYSGPVVFGSLASPAVSGAGQANLYFDGVGLMLSVNGGAYGYLGGGGGGGTVTGFSAGNLAPIFSTSVANATTTPALSFSLSTQVANRVFAGPASGADAAPSFRALAAADVPDLSGTYQPVDADLTAIAGLSTTAAGRDVLTKAAPANGALLIGNGSTFSAATLTQGSGVTITNGAGTITIAAAGGSPGGSSGQVQYNSGGSFAGANVLIPDANTVELRNSTTAQTLIINGTWTDSGNFRRATISQTAAGALVIDSTGLGTGASGNTIEFRTGGSTRISVDNIGRPTLAGSVVISGNVEIGGSTVYIDNTLFRLTSGKRLSWTNGGIFGSDDIGLSRVSAGILRVNNGSTGGGAVEFGQVSALGTVAADSARIGAIDVSGTAEIVVKDEAGNQTQISPHAHDAPASLYDEDEPWAQVSRESNDFLGVVRYVNHTRHREGRAGWEHLETYAEHNARLGLSGARALTVQDWDAVEAAKVARRNEERANWNTRRTDAESRGATFTEPQPPVYAAKPRPLWLVNAGARKTAQTAARAARVNRRNAAFADIKTEMQAYGITVNSDQEVMARLAELTTAAQTRRQGRTVDRDRISELENQVNSLMRLVNFLGNR